jgi:superfamily II DNA or RNA helicase
MLNEGFDLPAIDTVMMLRPTESNVLFLQQFGRGLRRAEGKERLRVDRAGDRAEHPRLLEREHRRDRHGQVAGLYAADPEDLGGIAEPLPPRLYRQGHDLDAAALQAGAEAAPRLAAAPELPQDAAELLAFAQDAARCRLSAPWAPVLPPMITAR